MYLVISEKPSVSQSIAKILGANQRREGYLEGADCIVSWCLGHLAEYVAPDAYSEKYRLWDYDDLPIIPDKWKLTVATDKREQFATLKELLNNPEFADVVNACDAGREGELIFRRVYELSGSHLPVKRLWISSMEDKAILDGFAKLKDGAEYKNLYEAAVCRAQADWLIGMNATRAFTSKYYKRLVIGRVQTPTLSMLVDRQTQIEHFEKKPYYTVSLEKDGFCVVSEKIAEEEQANIVAHVCEGKEAVIKKLEKNRKKSSPPKLYDLTTLQREANRIFGYTAQETLQELQELYEDKLITYPRTDSQYITEDMEESLSELVEQLPGAFFFLEENMLSNHAKRTVNNAKVSDHHAILPTKEALQKDLSGLSTKKKNIFCLLGQRVAQAVAGDCIYDETSVEVECEDYIFHAKGSSVKEPGYTAIADKFGHLFKKEKSEDKKLNDDIPEGLKEGERLEAVSAMAKQHFTSPPKSYSEDTLLAAMENAGKKEFDKDTEKKGIGTPATRASIIEKLVASGYAQRKGKQICPTESGTQMVVVIPEYLKSASMTAEWENQLLAMEKGKVNSSQFMEGIRNLLTMMLNGCDMIPEEERQRFRSTDSIGTCPVCGSLMFESKKNFYCSNKDCNFTLWKESHYLDSMRKSISKKEAAELLKNGRIHCKDLYSAKKQKTFEADLILQIKDGKANYSLEFPKKKYGKGKQKK